MPARSIAGVLVNIAYDIYSQNDNVIITILDVFVFICLEHKSKTNDNVFNCKSVAISFHEVRSAHN